MATHHRHDLSARRTASINVKILPERTIHGMVMNPLRKGVHNVRAVPSSLDKVVVDPPIQAAAILVTATCEQLGWRVEGRTIRIVREVAENREHLRTMSDKLAFVIAAELAPQEDGSAHVDLLPRDRRLLEVEPMDYCIRERGSLLRSLLNRSDLSDLPERLAFTGMRQER